MKISRDRVSLLSLTDFCKGIAISGIFLVHNWGGWFGWQGVHLFIVLSGFGLAYAHLNRKEELSWKAWYIKRFTKLLPAYWLAVILALPFLIAFQIFQGQQVWLPVARTFLDLLLLRNFFEGLTGGPSGALWFVPFIITCYLIFPFLYKNTKRSFRLTRSYLPILLIVAGLEFTYRAVAIYYFDGMPVAYNHSQFFGIFPDVVDPLNNLPDRWLFGFFQGRTPFRFFPSRLTEFTLGIVCAFALVHNNRKFNKTLLNPYTGLLGVSIWIIGQLLLVVGLWGWIFGDFMIGLGLMLWITNLAYFCRRIAPNVFQRVTWLGIWSYYIFLTHQPFTYLFRRIDIKISSTNSIFLSSISSLILLGLTLLSVGVASWLVRRIEQLIATALIRKRLIRPR